MFGPTRIWRRWHRKINVNEKRYATASALAASAVRRCVCIRLRMSMQPYSSSHIDLTIVCDGYGE